MEDRTALLQQVQDAARTEIDAFEKSGSGGLAVPFFKMLKDLTYEGYFTSEKVGKEVLRFDPIPGSYQGCIPLEDVGRLWTI